MYYGVLVASSRFHGKESLTYSWPEKLALGQLVSVPLQSKQVTGIVDSVVDKPSFTTKEILGVWPLFIPALSLELIRWLRQYYPAPLGNIAELFTPPSLIKKMPEANMENSRQSSPAKLPPLTSDQKNILKSISQTDASSTLLHGATGTGKTRIYIELAKKALDKNQSTIILTPEIGLTAPLLKTFIETFGDRVLVTHSAMTSSERRQVWLAANKSIKGIIILGPRSALFSPLKQIGLIVMDEAHDSAYKQQGSPYYQTSRVAARLAHLHKAKFIMGTATPPVSDYYAFDQKKLPILAMTKPAITTRQTTLVEIIDQRNRENFMKSSWIADILISSIGDAIKSSEQSLLFLNRRGSARLVLCETCGWQALCPHCDVALTYHQDKHLMVCHSCDFSSAPPTKCPNCGASEISFKSIGTKALETEIIRLFPSARVNRFDSDTDKLSSLQHHYQALQSGKIDIIIGTQTVAKGFDLPNLSVVGIMQADSGLQIPDYTATERTYQLLSQVSGRIGRGHRNGKLFVQTYNPSSPLIEMALKKEYEHFYKQELQQRDTYNFPPYYFLMKITCVRASSFSARAACQKIRDDLTKVSRNIIVEGPSPRFIEKIAGKFAWHLIVKSKSRANLVAVAADLPGNCTYDLDPVDLL